MVIWKLIKRTLIIIRVRLDGNSTSTYSRILITEDILKSVALQAWARRTSVSPLLWGYDCMFSGCFPRGVFLNSLWRSSFRPHIVVPEFRSSSLRAAAEVVPMDHNQMGPNVPVEVLQVWMTGNSAWWAVDDPCSTGSDRHGFLLQQRPPSPSSLSSTTRSETYCPSQLFLNNYRSLLLYAHTLLVII